MSSIEPQALASDYPEPHPVQFQGSALARRVLLLLGWRVLFVGFPAKQGVLAVYPHTSNWDFVVMLLAKWSLGVPIQFWGKESLFKLPLFGRWMRHLGGVPVQRTAPGGAVGQMLARFARCKAEDQYFWLGLSPEGTRKRLAGWRSGFYQIASGAQVPLALVSLDYSRRLVDVTCFVTLCGDSRADMARIAERYQGVKGRLPAQASPVELLDAAVNRGDTVVK